ncbi:MAG: aldo/keto reductase [candidate division Zixibacteria bacterium]|nr:aldo/keto reductase [candidate division Zixibacteria bacterium]
MTEQSKKLSRLGLGTVQFGADYGISNVQGQSSFAQAREILAEAHRQGIAFIDTSPAYGVGEEVVGRCLPGGHAFKIVTKTPVLGTAALTDDDAMVVKSSFYRSLQRLGQESLYALLVHRTDDLLARDGELLWDVMSDLKKWGLVEKIGVSVYSGDQIDRLLARFPIDIVQVPLNVFDQRLIRSGHLARLQKRNVEIHARSIFLQGLLLMPLDDVPAYFRPVYPKLAAWRNRLREHGLSPAAAAENFARSVPEPTCFILGVNDKQQLTENIAAWNTPVEFDYDGFAVEDENMVDPARWEVR